MDRELYSISLDSRFTLAEVCQPYRRHVVFLILAHRYKNTLIRPVIWSAPGIDSNECGNTSFGCSQMEIYKHLTLKHLRLKHVQLKQ
jgi:hypothetical protein